MDNKYYRYSDLLIEAIIAGNAVECRRLLQESKEGEEEGECVVDIHERDSTNGFSPIVLASQNDHVDIVELLLSRGANIHDKTNRGMSSIILASSVGYVATVQLLLSKGANIHDKTGDGSSPIIIASAYGHVDIIELLLPKGANIHDRDNDSRTPIMWASMNGRVATVQLLLSHDANVNDTSNGGYNSLSYAYNDITKAALLEWPTTMGIIMLQELGIIFIIDSESVIDLNQYITRDETLHSF